MSRPVLVICCFLVGFAACALEVTHSFDRREASTVFDVGPQGFHGLLFGAETCPGKTGNAIRFDGQDDYRSRSAPTESVVRTA